MAIVEEVQLECDGDEEDLRRTLRSWKILELRWDRMFVVL